MIGSLRGTLTLRQPPALLVEVGGVGYEVQAPMSTFYGLPQTGAEVALYTHLITREDARELYGFATLAERELFRALIKVSGVGGRVALSVLSGMSVEDFRACVQSGDATALRKVPGVGKKTADRLIVELGDRVAQLARGERVGSAPSDARGEAMSALAALGYRSAEITRMLESIDTTGRSTEEIIRLALQTQAERA